MPNYSVQINTHWYYMGIDSIEREGVDPSLPGNTAHCFLFWNPSASYSAGRALHCSISNVLFFVLLPS